jgi:hypothetical protein
MQETTIYVELLEGTIVFAPVPALHLGERYYKILEHNREDYDTLRFNTGTYVLCLLSKLSVNENLVPVAYCEVNKEQVEYIVSNLTEK